MHIENGRVVLETRTCFECDGSGAKEELLRCPRYGMPQNGKPCPHCGSRKKEYHQYLKTGRQIDCGRCKGSGQVEEDACDSMPPQYWQTVEMRVYRQNREMTWVESHLALGCVYACVDYGRVCESSDEQVIEKVRTHEGSVQACKVARGEDLELCDHIGIFVNRDGYMVRAVFRKKEKEAA